MLNDETTLDILNQEECDNFFLGGEGRNILLKLNKITEKYMQA